MLIVRVELHSAITGKVTELARMIIANRGDGSFCIGNYDVQILRGRDSRVLDRRVVQKSGEVLNHPRLRKHVWWLVAKALAATGYLGPEEAPAAARRAGKQGVEAPGG